MHCSSFRDINLFASVVGICILHLLLTKYSRYLQRTFYNFKMNLFIFLCVEAIQLIRMLVHPKLPRYMIVDNSALKDWQYSLPPKAMRLRTKVGSYLSKNESCIFGACMKGVDWQVGLVYLPVE